MTSTRYSRAVLVGVALTAVVLMSIFVVQTRESAWETVPASTSAATAVDPRADSPVSQPSSGTGANPVVGRVPRDQWKRIVATGTWRPGCPVGRKDLRRLEVSYVDFSGREQRGVLVAHRDSINDLAEIFSSLYDTKFPIARMQPVEDFGGDVAASLAANNTSAFNCRKPDQINAPVTQSPHANGRAVDINPIQNPWKDVRCTCWMPSQEFKGAKQTGAGVIRRGSPVIRQFTDRGWVWQNIKVPDYMHFDTGYPSRAR